MLRSASTSFAARATVSSLSLLVAIAIACQGGAKSARAACHAMAQRLSALDGAGRLTFVDRREALRESTEDPRALPFEKTVAIAAVNTERPATVQPASPWLTGLPPPATAL